MRFYLLEVPVFESPEIEPREKCDNNKYRNSKFELRKQSLPEYACVSQILEPHPVGDESDAHDQERQHKSYDHDSY